MTVCIAAVCNFIQDRPRCVITAADRMITIGDIEYEPNQTKSVWFATNTIGLFAGDMQLHAAVVPKVLKRVNDALRANPANLNVSEIAEFYAEEFAFYRRSLAEREILMPRGLSFDRFLARQSTMAHWQVNELDAHLAAHNIDSTAIIAGIDLDGAHIYKITDPGVAMCFNTPFFAAAGAGEELAKTQFMVNKYDKQWPVERALWLTFTAKARAEMAGGVGRQTDMVLIGAGRSHVLTEDQKNTLYEIFRRTEKQEEVIAAAAVAEVRRHMEEAAAKEDAAEKQTANQEMPDPAPKSTKKKRIGKKPA